MALTKQSNHTLQCACSKAFFRKLLGFVFVFVLELGFLELFGILFP